MSLEGFALFCYELSSHPRRPQCCKESFRKGLPNRLGIGSTDLAKAPCVTTIELFATTVESVRDSKSERYF